MKYSGKKNYVNIESKEGEDTISTNSTTKRKIFRFRFSRKQQQSPISNSQPLNCNDHGQEIVPNSTDPDGCSLSTMTVDHSQDLHVNHHQAKTPLASNTTGKQRTALLPLAPIHEALGIAEHRINNTVHTNLPPSNKGSTKNNRQTRDTSKTGNGNNQHHPSSYLRWLCRTKYFSNLCDKVFDMVDHNKSGTVDENELYQGLLLIHLQLGTYAGPAACKPLGREKCHDVFLKMDYDQSGLLDKNEFKEVMMVLFGNVILRVIVQWYMTIIFVPLFAKYTYQQLCMAVVAISTFIQDLDEYKIILNIIEFAVEDIYEYPNRHIPSVIKSICSYVSTSVQSIPDNVWNSIPLTLISSIIGMVIVPYVIFKVDDFFTWLGDLFSKSRTSNKSNLATNNQHGQ